MKKHILWITLISARVAGMAVTVLCERIPKQCRRMVEKHESGIIFLKILKLKPN